MTQDFITRVHGARTKNTYTSVFNKAF